MLVCVCVCARARVCVCACVRVCVSVSPRPLITSGVIWCDIDHVQLVKQVLWLFPQCSQFLYDTCRDKMDGRGLISTARRVFLPRKTKVTRY